MLSETLSKLNLPELKSREEMIDILLREEYGYLPPKPQKLEFEKVGPVCPNFCAGNAVCEKIIAHCDFGEKTFSFPFYATIPTDNKKHPFFVHINFRPDVPDRFQPTEELVDNGFAVLSFNHKDVTSDDKDFTNGLAGVLFKNGERGATDAGKISMWAWAAHRVMDYAETISDVLDLNRSVVCGHSRLGKTALLTAATDTRFKFAYSNDSGCSGAAISRGNDGESIESICNHFPFWFCKNYYKYAKNEDKMPFDQHFLAAAIAPRFVLIGSAHLDLWANPKHEQLCCFAASPAFKNGFVCPDRFAEIGEEFFDGDIGYHLRRGTHYFSRQDWQKLIKFVNSK